MNNLLMKRDLTTEQLTMVNSEVEKKQKSKGIAFAMWFFFGGLGGHRYYMGDIGYALVMTFTLGGLGVWTLIDAFFIGNRIDQKTEELEHEAIQTVKSFDRIVS